MSLIYDLAITIGLLGVLAFCIYILSLIFGDLHR